MQEDQIGEPIAVEIPKLGQRIVTHQPTTGLSRLVARQLDESGACEPAAGLGEVDRQPVGHRHGEVDELVAIE